jgi:hypothetical protein
MDSSDSFTVGSEEWLRSKIEAKAASSSLQEAGDPIVNPLASLPSERRAPPVGSADWKHAKMQTQAVRSQTSDDTDAEIVYGVAVGREIGVFDTWDECNRSVKGYPGAKFKGFESHAKASAWVASESSRIEAAAFKAIEVDSSIKQAYTTEKFRCCLHFGASTFICGWANSYFPFACTVGPHW